MIRVQPAKQPQDFYILVEKPGQEFLNTTPQPSQDQWKSHNYWRLVADDLHKSYKGVCAYYCQYIPLVTGSDTVEHFMPKSHHPVEAYKWSNYRLVCGMMNGRKGNYEDVLDPFNIGDDWFVVDFDTYMVCPNDKLDINTKKQVERTIKRLKLNKQDCIEGRMESLRIFAEFGGIEFLDWYAPLIARELRKQEKINEIRQRFLDLVAAGYFNNDH